VLMHAEGAGTRVSCHSSVRPVRGGGWGGGAIRTGPWSAGGVPGTRPARCPSRNSRLWGATRWSSASGPPFWASQLQEASRPGRPLHIIKTFIAAWHRQHRVGVAPQLQRAPGRLRARMASTVFVLNHHDAMTPRPTLNLPLFSGFCP